MPGPLFDENDSNRLVGWDGTPANGIVVVPSNVTSIGPDAFMNRTDITGIDWGTSVVTSIGNRAFLSTKITAITIPSSITDLGTETFFQCYQLGSVVFQSGLTEIKNYTFANTGLSSITLPSSLTTIGYGAFYNIAGLTSVTIPSSVTSIGPLAFGNCSALETIVLQSGLLEIQEYAFNYTNLISVTIPSSVTTLGSAAFSSCPQLTTVVIQSGLTEIQQLTFSDCPQLSSITLPSSVTTIGDAAFNGCTALTSIDLSNITSISSVDQGVFAFSGLTSVTIPGTMTMWGDRVFKNCTSLTSVTIGEGITTIPYASFLSCNKLSSVSFPSSLTTIGDNAFNGCGFTSLTIPTTITSIANSAFVGNKFKYIEFAGNAPAMDGGIVDTDVILYYTPGATGWDSPSIVANYGGKVFGVDSTQKEFLTITTAADLGTKLASLSGTVDTIQMPVFNVAGLLTATAPGLSTILASAPTTFVTAGPGSSVTLPTLSGTNSALYFRGSAGDSYTLTAGGASVTMTIGTSGVTIGSTAYSLGDVVTIGTHQYIVAGNGSVVFVTNLLKWNSDNTAIIGTVGAVTEIPANAFANNTTLTSVDLSTATSLTTIGAYAFMSCSALTSVALPNSVTSLGDAAFANCTSLSSVNIPTGVTQLGANLFNACSVLSSITIPSGVTSIGAYVFASCSSLSSITIPSGVTSIGDGAFNNCSALTSITYPSSVTTLGTALHDGCTNLTTIDLSELMWMTTFSYVSFAAPAGATVALPSSITELDLTGLSNTITSYVFPASLTTLAGNMQGFASLTSVDMSSCTSLTSIAANFFNGCTQLASVQLPPNITTIPNTIFLECTSLASITIPSGVTTIGDYAFYSCSGLTGSIVFPSGITYVGQNAFAASNVASVVFLGDAPIYGVYGDSFPNTTRLYYLSTTTGWANVPEFAGKVAIDNVNQIPIMDATDSSSLATALADLAASSVASVQVSGFNIGQFLTTVNPNQPSTDFDAMNVTFFTAAPGGTVTMPSSVTVGDALYFRGSGSFSYTLALPDASTVTMEYDSTKSEFKVDGTIYALGSTVTIGTQPYIVGGFGSVLLIGAGGGGGGGGGGASSGWTQLGATFSGAANAMLNVVAFAPNASGIGETLAIGAPGENKVYVYQWTTSDGTNYSWLQWGDAISPNDGNNVFFGGAVVMNTTNGAVVAVGDESYSDGVTNKQGQVSVYMNNGSGWALMGSPLLPDLDVVSFGSSIAMSADGTVLAVGAYGSNLVYTYVYNPTTGAWDPRDSALAGSGAFGKTVALSSDGSIMAVGAPDYDNQTGRVSIFQWSNGAWSAPATLDGTGANDAFGTSVSLSNAGTDLIVGMPGAQIAAVYGYAAGTWTQRGSNLSLAGDGGSFGASVAMSANGNTVAVGSPQSSLAGTATVFSWNSVSSAWDQVGDSIAPTANDAWGSRIALTSDGSTIALGVQLADAMAGTARVYVYGGALTLTLVSQTPTEIVYQVSSPYPTDLSFTGSDVLANFDYNAATGRVTFSVDPYTVYENLAVVTTDVRYSTQSFAVPSVTTDPLVQLVLTFNSKTDSTIVFELSSTPVLTAGKTVTLVGNGYYTSYDAITDPTKPTVTVSGLSASTPYIFVFQVLDDPNYDPTYTFTTAEITTDAASGSGGGGGGVNTPTQLSVTDANMPGTTTLKFTAGQDRTATKYPDDITVAINGTSVARTYSNLTGSITITGLAAGTTYDNIVFSTTDPDFTGTVELDGITTLSSGGGGGGGSGGAPPCFLGSARLRMADGSWCRIRDLAEGAMVAGAEGAVAVTRVIRKTVTASAAVNPYVIPAGQWGARRRLLISPAHRVAVPGRGLVPAEELGLKQHEMDGEFDYYNVEIEGNGNMNVEGVEVESLAPVRRLVVSKEEFVALVKAKYGHLPLSEAHRLIRATCRQLADGRVEIPVVARR